MLTAKGVKPICNFQQVYKNTYLFGTFSPINGNHFLYELNTCDADTFQCFLNQFSAYEPEEYKIIVLDNGAFHKAKSLQIPKNIKLCFLPPYAPELNPAEKMWQSIKRQFSNQYYKTLDEISSFFTYVAKGLSKSLVKSTCSYNYIFIDLDWTIM